MPPVLPRGHRLPALAPQSDDDYQDDEQRQDECRRSVLRVGRLRRGCRRPRRAAVAWSSSSPRCLALAVIGTAGAFAYRTMFGGSLLPTLPPIIKASDGPNKIVPAQAADAAANADPERVRHGRMRSWCRARSSRSTSSRKTRRRASSPRFRSRPPTGPQSSNSTAPVAALRQVGISAAPLPAPAAPAPAAGSPSRRKFTPSRYTPIHRAALAARLLAPAALPRGPMRPLSRAEACSGARRQACSERAARARADR